MHAETHDVYTTQTHTHARAHAHTGAHAHTRTCALADKAQQDLLGADHAVAHAPRLLLTQHHHLEGGMGGWMGGWVGGLWGQRSRGGQQGSRDEPAARGLDSTCLGQRAGRGERGEKGNRRLGVMGGLFGWQVVGVEGRGQVVGVEGRGLRGPRSLEGRTLMACSRRGRPMASAGGRVAGDGGGGEVSMGRGQCGAWHAAEARSAVSWRVEGHTHALFTCLAHLLREALELRGAGAGGRRQGAGSAGARSARPVSTRRELSRELSTSLPVCPPWPSR
jgi:hypothetical protein